MGGLPHLLFYGPPGTGKTSSILAIAKQIYGSGYRNMVLELNASDDRGIDVVREQIKNFASTTSVFGPGLAQRDGQGAAKYKLIILDEADSMTQTAQAALRRIIEKYTKNVRFCLICNYATRISPAIQSRCTKFRFRPLDVQLIRARLDYIIRAENVHIEPSAVDAILRISNGDMRRVLNVLQGCSLAHDHIDEDCVYSVTGQPRPADIKLMFDSLLNDEFSVCYSYISNLKSARGLALVDIVTCLFSLVSICQFPAQSTIYIINQLAELECRLANNASDQVQLSSLIGSFKIAVQLAV